MIITSIVINIETDGKNDEDLQPKSLIYEGNRWKLPSDMFPRDIRLLTSLQELIDGYNSSHHGRKEK